MIVDRHHALKGLWVPVITPFDDQDDVDLAALDRLGRRLLLTGCSGLVALGTTGESATLSRAEKDRVVAVCDRVCADAGKPLIVGVGSNCTRSTINEARHVSELGGATALLVVVPYYSRPSEAAIVEHFKTVAAASSLPVVIYNVPYRTGRGLGADAILELAATSGIIGLKQAVGCLDDDTLEILAQRPAGFAVLAGDDAYIAPTIMLGGDGAIAASAHVCTTEFSRLVTTAIGGEVAEAAALGHALLPVVRAGFAEPNPAVWKAVLHNMGEIGTPDLRAPMAAASAAATAEIVAAIRSVRTSSGSHPAAAS